MQQVNLSERTYMHPGNMSCPGCGGGIAMNLVLKALGEKTVMVIPACCWAIIAGPHPQTSLKVPILHTAFETAAVTAGGVRAGLDMRGDTQTTVVAWAGDGGTFDIGLQSLSGTAERGDNILFICYDNEAYMNTGVQRSSSTPFGTRTTTTPGAGWKKTRKKDIMEIMAAHRIPYAATANIAFPQDLVRKVEKAKKMTGGTRFIHIYATCPTGWGIASDQSVKIARLATRTNAFPLYEVERGVEYTLNESGDLPVEAYLKVQGRFKHLTESDVNEIQRDLDREVALIKKKAGL
jgi:pyruvate ferredoxin oxidoreductase beta subunit/2-oxoisovalerate ferredoxin oxidoreductase beta subunit